MYTQYSNQMSDFASAESLYSGSFTPGLIDLTGASLHGSTDGFLNVLNEQLDKHLSDVDLTVKRLSRLAGMSRSNLHRKLVATVGMSTSAYMRHYRLHKAAKLLVAYPEWGIFQVALEVGFSNQSYFSRRFKEVFSVCPSDWRPFVLHNFQHTFSNVD